MNDKILKWLREKRTDKCLMCKPRVIPHSLVKTTCICPQCDRIWKWRADISTKIRHGYVIYMDLNEIVLGSQSVTGNKISAFRLPRKKNENQNTESTETEKRSESSKDV